MTPQLPDRLRRGQDADEDEGESENRGGKSRLRRFFTVAAVLGVTVLALRRFRGRGNEDDQ